MGPGAALFQQQTPQVWKLVLVKLQPFLVTSCPLKAKNFSIILGVSESPPMQRGP